MAARTAAPAAGQHAINPKRWAVILVPLLVLALACHSVMGGQAIDIVLSTDDAPYRRAAAVAADALEQRGYTTRRVLLEEFERQPPESVSAAIGVGSAAARHLHRRIEEPEPVVTYCMVGDPEDQGLTQGRPVYGVSVQVSVAAQFALIERVLPEARSVGMIYRTEDGGDRWRSRAEAALPSHWMLYSVALEDHDNPSDAIAALLRHDVDVVWTMPDRSVYKPATVRALLLATLRQRTPVFGFSPAFVRAGALLGVGMTPESQGRRAAELTWQYLEEHGRGRASSAADRADAGGSAPSQPRVYAPPFQIAVNQIVAERLGITLPPDLVREADYVFTPEGP